MTNSYKKPWVDYWVDTHEEMEQQRRAKYSYDDHLEEIEDEIKKEVMI